MKGLSNSRSLGCLCHVTSGFLRIARAAWLALPVLRCSQTHAKAAREARPRDLNGPKNLDRYRQFLLSTGVLLLAVATSPSYAAIAINWATLAGGASVTVAPGAAISAEVNATTSGGTKWQSTAWRISTTAPGTTSCANTGNIATDGTYSEIFDITAPTLAGTYNAYFIAYAHASNCSSTASPVFPLANGVIVPPPTVSSINRVGTTPTNAASVQWTVTFSRAVTGVNVADFALVNGGLTGPVISAVTGSGTTWTVTAGSYTGAGSLGLNLVDDNSIVDTSASANPLGGTGAGDGNFTGQSYTIDRTVPTIPTATIASSNAVTTEAIPGDIVTLTFTVDDNTGAVQTPVVTIGVGAGIVSGAYPNFTASRVMTAGDAQGTVPFTINVSDTAGNAATALTAITSGSNVTFKRPPTATTNAASGITSAVAILNGTVSSNGTATTVYFDYGLTAAYGSTITMDTPASPLASGATDTAVSAALIGLNCSTLFHYRVVATNSGGITYGSNTTFTTGACTAPFPATACAATRFNGNLGCTANDVNLTGITLAPPVISSCVSGTPVTLNLDLTVNFSSPNRYDVGIFIANDGKLPTLLSGSGGASSCTVDILPITPPLSGTTFPDLDGVPKSTADTCGDGNSTINGGTGNGIKRMSSVTLPCFASAASAGQMFVPFAVSWDNQASPIGSLCTSNLYPVPNTSSKCNAPASSVSIPVVVLPVITKTDGTSNVGPGANTTYTVTITNNSGGVLLGTVFTDPAVANLTINSVSCLAAGGATCPSVTVAALQGAGVTIPSASLPNNSSLTFTMNATVSALAPLGSHIINTATVTVGGSSASAVDDDLVANVPSATMSFTPATITEAAGSVLTVTLTNPTGSPVTGVGFTDSYPSGLVNTAAAGAATTCTGGILLAADNGSSLTYSGGTIPASSSCTITVNVTAAVAGSYLNSTGAISASSGTISAAMATLTVNVAVYGGFNVCDTATAPNATCTNTTTSTNSHIVTKIAGAAFSLDVVALNTNGTRNTGYNKTFNIELLDAGNNSGAIDGNNCRSTWVSMVPAVTVSSGFVGGDNGLKQSISFTVPEAYRDVRVKVTSTGGATKIGCSTDNFAIRPNSLVVSATDTDWLTSGVVRTLNNTADTSPGSWNSTPNPIHKAGQPFTITVTGKNASNLTTTRYAATVNPTPSYGVCTPGTACTAAFGTVTLGTGTSSLGVITYAAASYSEVGAFDLTLTDSDFTSVDASDSPANCAGRYVCSAPISVGRFVPDHFAITPGVVGSGCGTFTYFGQDGFTTPFTLTAQNAANLTTANYAGNGVVGLAKLPLTTWAGAGPPPGYGYGFAVSTWAPSQPAGASFAASATAPSASPANNWVAGVATVTAKHKIVRSTAEAVPTTVTVTAWPVDSDGITTAAATTLGSAIERFGRLRLVSGQGSTTAGYTMKTEAQYWDGAAWSTNTLDSCTIYVAGNAKVTGTSGRLITGAAGITSGFGSISLSTPTSNDVASVCLDLASSADGCTATTTPASLDYLRGNWSVSTFDKDPSGTVTSGADSNSRGNWGFLYRRERF